MTTPYAVLKNHFDKLIFGGYPSNTGLESIRDVYNDNFKTNINLYDVYQSQIRVAQNSVSSIATLIGPDNEEINIPDGILQCERDIVSVNVLSDSILKGIDEDNVKWYIDEVYNSMTNVIMMDRLYKVKGFRNRTNPYAIFIKCAPFYFTYHHVKEATSTASLDGAFVELLDDIFTSLLEKYIIANENTAEVMESVRNNKYSEDPNDIARIMTVDFSIDLI